MVDLLLIVSLAFITTFVGKPDSLEDKSDKSCFIRFQLFFFIASLALDFLYLLSSDKSELLLILDFLYFLSSEKSDFLDDESDDDGYNSGYYGMYYLPLFLCVLMILLVVSVAWVLEFLHKQELSLNVIFLRVLCLYQ